MTILVNVRSYCTRDQFKFCIDQQLGHALLGDVQKGLFFRATKEPTWQGQEHPHPSGYFLVIVFILFIYFNEINVFMFFIF